MEIDNETVREIYHNLTPEAKEIFDRELSRDPQLLSFHLKNVDSSFSQTKQKHSTNSYSFRSVGALRDPMVTLSNQIATLGLPSAVAYSLKAMGASMVAAIGDGPLPFGDILLAASTASVAITMGLNWDVVEPKFDRIVQAFRTAFSSVGSNISSAFSKIKTDAKKENSKNKNKDLEKVKNKIPSRLKKPNGNVDLGKFKTRLKNRQGYKEDGGWTIDRDKTGHKGSKWKLKDKSGNRVGSLDENGKIVGD